MAVILPGPLVSDVRGRVGDLVFERNAGGLYVRSKGTVTQVASDPRDAAHAALGLVSTRFRTVLTNDQRKTWTDYARQWPDVDRWGRDKVRTGQQAYCSFNFHHALASLSAFSDVAPTLPPFPHSVPYVYIDSDVPSIYLYSPIQSWDTPGTGQHWYCYQGLPVNSTRNYFSSPFRFSGLLEDAGPGWIGYTEWTPVFTVDEGKTSWVRIIMQQANPLRESRRLVLKAVHS